MNKQKNLLTYILSPITKIYASEQPKAFFAFLAYFLLMTSYYLIRPTRSSLFMKAWGTNWMPVFYLIIAGFVLGTSFIYNLLVTRFQRTSFIRIVFGGVLVSFLAVWTIKTYPNILPFEISETVIATFWYIWICAYILFLTSLFWSFTHDLHTPEQSRRLYPLILLGAQFGVIFGSHMTKWLLNSFATWSEKSFGKRIEMSNYDLILVSSFFLILVWSILEILRFFDKKEQSDTENTNTQTHSTSNYCLNQSETILYASCLAVIVIFGTLALTIFDYQYKRMIERDIVTSDVLIQEQDFNNSNEILTELQDMNEDISNILYSYEPTLKNFAQPQNFTPEEREKNIKEACHLLNNIIEKGQLYIKINLPNLNISSRTSEILDQTEDIHRCNRIIIDNIFSKSLNHKRHLLESDAKERSSFLADNDYWMGWLNILLLFIIAPRILRFFGPGVTVLFYPIVCIIAAGCFICGMSVYTARIFAVIISSLSYTMYLVGKETFYVPTDSNIRYKAKAVIDAFGYRLGDALGGLVTLGYVWIIGISALWGLSTILFIMAIPWFLAIYYVSKMYRILDSESNSQSQINDQD